MSLPKLKGQWSIAQLTLILLLFLLIVVGAIPGYFSGNWPWAELIVVDNINQVRSIRETGLTLPSWKTLDQAEVRINDKKWSAQLLQQGEDKPVTLLLLPQPSSGDHPQIDWVDINGIERWQTDSSRKLKFTLTSPWRATVEARFFRAWNQRQTWAVVQWYAQPDGGTFAPRHWFWADLLAQVHRSRVPWIAVSLKIPMKPLGDLEKVQPLAESLAKAVQASLMAGPFSKYRGN